MALQQFVCCFTVLIIFLCQGCHSEQLTCGRAVRNTRIIGGQDAAPGSWPWFAVVNTDYGGTLITDQWVLTSASVGQSSRNTVVYLGRQTRSGPNPNEVSRTVENVTCHPNFSILTLENDICLLKLSAPVNFTEYIRPICLASENSTLNITSSWTIGFGRNSSFPFPNILQEVNLPIVGPTECKEGFGEPSFVSAIENGICAGATEKTPCSFDEGGPLMTKEGSVWVQSGVLSDTLCGGPALYTRVSRYQKWISDTVTGTSPTTAPTTLPATSPTAAPTTLPPTSPTAAPTTLPATSPTAAPTTLPPTSPPTAPTTLPATSPTAAPTTLPPTSPPTAPTTLPATSPTAAPTTLPPTSPTAAPTTLPATSPTAAPTTLPATSPTAAPTTLPPTSPPTAPTTLPATSPTAAPTTLPPTSPPTAPTTLPATSPTAAPTTLPATSPPTTPTTLPPTDPTPLTCESVFCCGENLIHFTHFTSLCALVVFLHIFAGIGGT